jgi:ABC-type branched-subunit amino acid transport system substrate-binding protein
VTVTDISLPNGLPLSIRVSNNDGTTWSDGFAINAPLFWATQKANPPSHLNSASSPSVLRLGVYMNGGDPEEFRGLKIALKIALDEVNEDTNVLPVTRLELVEIVTNGDKALAVSQGKALVRDDDLVGIVGAQWSSVSIQVSKHVASPNTIPMLSYGSTNPALSDTRAHPYFLRLCGSDSLQGKILADVIQKFGWRRAGIVWDNDEYAQGLRTSLRHRATQLEIDFYDIGVLEMPASSDYGRTLDDVVGKLASASTSIIVLLTLSPLPFFRKASEAGFTGPSWQYLGTDGMSSVVASAAASDADALAGLIFTSIPVSSNRKSSEFRRFSKQMINAVPKAFFIHDAVKMYASVLHSMVSNAPPVPLSSSSFGDESPTKVVCPVSVSGLPCLAQCRPHSDSLAQELVCLVSTNKSCTSEADCSTWQMFNATCVRLDASDAVCPRHSFKAPPRYTNCRAFRGSIISAVVVALAMAAVVALSATWYVSACTQRGCISCTCVCKSSKSKESTIQPQPEPDSADVEAADNPTVKHNHACRLMRRESSVWLGNDADARRTDHEHADADEGYVAETLQTSWLKM